MMIIKTWRDPYDCGMSTTRPKQIELKPGLTVLVGCNGAGKTTLIKNIKSECIDHKIPVHMWTNDDSSNSALSILGTAIGVGEGVEEFGATVADGVNLWTASEGESLVMRVARQSGHIRKMLDDGKLPTRRNMFAAAFGDDGEEEKKIDTNIRVIMFDASDSGVSIDHVVELKEHFINPMLDYANRHDIELYLIIASNEYELCDGTPCFDVMSGKYVTFNNYVEYKKFILDTRKRKEKRLDVQARWVQRQVDKGRKLIEDNIDKIAASEYCQPRSNIENDYAWSCHYCKYYNTCHKIKDVVLDYNELLDILIDKYPNLKITHELKNRIY